VRKVWISVLRWRRRRVMVEVVVEVVEGEEDVEEAKDEVGEVEEGGDVDGVEVFHRD
jgi:hypothetical protein